MMNSQVLRDQKEILPNSNIKSYTELKEVLLLLFVAPFQSTRVGPFWSDSDLWSLVTRLRHTFAASIGGGAVHQFSLKRIYTDKIFWTLALNCAHIYSQLPWLPPYLSFWNSNGLHFLEGDQTETNFVKYDQLFWKKCQQLDGTVDHQIDNDLSRFSSSFLLVNLLLLINAILVPPPPLGVDKRCIEEQMPETSACYLFLLRTWTDADSERSSWAACASLHLYSSECWTHLQFFHDIVYSWELAAMRMILCGLNWKRGSNLNWLQMSVRVFFGALDNKEREVSIRIVLGQVDWW